jgi:hypothetical protein
MSRDASRPPGGQSAPTAEQLALLREVEAHREPFLQAWWAQRLWQGQRLRTASGAPLEVLEPGWLNRGGGPDFTEARLLIDGQEHWGDVEVHLDEADWRGHGHADDPAYSRVILHVVLRRAPPSAASPVALAPYGGAPIPVLEAAPYLSRGLLEVLDEPAHLLRRYERLPGRCGLRAAVAGPEAVQRIVAHAAESRARAKATRVLAAAAAPEREPDEQLLYRQLCYYLGYRPHTPLFEALARRFPVAQLAPLLALPPAEARMEVLARWFGSAGLLEAEAAGTPDPAQRAEYAALRARWRSLGLAPLGLPTARGGTRPMNSAERRLVGLYHHLQAIGRDGWLRGWLRLLHRLDGLRDAPGFRREALALLEQAFATPTAEPWRTRVSFHGPPGARPARLVGTERMIVLLANAVLPTFLAFARRDGDAELEKLLYRLYIVLPPEGANRRTRFMEERLAPVLPLPRTLRTHQGLLQIHQDFCRSFYEGCSRCRLPELLAAGSPGAAQPAAPAPAEDPATAPHTTRKSPHR